MASIWWRPFGKTRDVPVDERNPLPMRMPEDPWSDVGQPPIAGRTVIRQREVPGIGTGAAYADLDVMGTTIEFEDMVRPSKRTGLLLGGTYHDLDDEGLRVQLHLFSRSVTPTGADNTALVITDSDMQFYLCSLDFTTFNDFNTSQTSEASCTKPIKLLGTSIFAVAQARSAPNIAAGQLPRFTLLVLPD